MKFFACTESTHVASKSKNQRFAQIIILIFTTNVFFFGYLQIGTAQTVHIPDPGLRTAIELALGKQAGADITQADMASLQSLDAFESGVRNLKGLEFATNLTELHLGLNRISDISPLKGLTNLTTLDLHRNKYISDVSPLKSLTNLNYISLRGNRISDMSPLEDLTNLTFLHIGYNRISDISPLKNLAVLSFLNLDENRISDISLLRSLINLTELHLDDNKISDMSPLKDLINLTFLNINDNEVSDISPLKNLKNLTTLNLHGNKILDVSTLKDLTELKILRLHENQISDLAPLKDLTKLRVLQLHENQISDLAPLKDLTELKKLDLHGNEISDVAPLQSLTNLTHLDLSNNQISDFSPIAGLIRNLVKYDNSNQTVPSINAADVNRDGVVDVMDLVLVAFNYRNPDFANATRFGIYLDVNSDGVVDVKDLIAVAAEIDAAAAAPVLRKNPTVMSSLTAKNLTQWIQLAKQLHTQGTHTQKGIAVLEQLLATLTFTEVPPQETAVLSNYPNPFNPETWIPYQLATPAKVNIFIRSVDGKLVRMLELGYLSVGVYHSKSRAAYWDGRNEFGESVASGLYFYTFTASDFTATGKMIIRK